jgi:hypothetical protein
MKLIKAKEKAPCVNTQEPTLKQRIEQTRAESEQYIQQYVDRLKASDDGKLLPRDWLLLDTRLQHGKNCSCQCALSLIDLEQK